MQLSRCLKVKKIIKDILIIIIGTLSIIFSLEIFLTLYFPQNLKVDYINNIPLGKKHKVLGHVNNPLSETALKGPEFSCIYAINGQGFRDASDYSAPKQSSINRILLLGDSFTFGAGNNYHKIWPVIFENELRKNGNSVEVIKAGVPAYDTRTEALYLEDIFDQLNPDIVVINFLPNDLFTNYPVDIYDKNNHEMDDMVRKQTIKSSYNIPTMLKRVMLSSDFIYSRLFYNTFRGDFFKDSSTFRKQITVTEKLFDRVVAFTREKGVSLVLHSIPQLFQVIIKANGYQINGVDVDLIDKKLLAYSKQKSIVFIDSLDRLSLEYKNKKEVYYRVDGHLNEIGNKVVGINLYEKLMKSSVSRLINNKQ